MFRLELTHNNQWFSLPYGNTVDFIEVDPDFQLISRNNTVLAGIQNTILEADVHIYPNPIKDKLEIDLTNNLSLESITIFNTLGQKVLQQNANFDVISLAELNTGVYNLEIVTNKGKIDKKIIKQ